MSGYQAMVVQTGAAANSRQIEHKAVTLNSLLSVPSGDTTWSTVQLLNGITQGVASTARIGRKIVLTSLQLRWFYDAPSAATNVQYRPFRICIIYDSAPEGVLPSPSLIFDDNSALGNMNLNSSERFIVLHDEYVGGTGSLPIANASWGSRGFCGKYYKKFNPPLQTHFNATLGTIADINKGAIYLMFCNFAGAGSDSTMDLFYNSRVRFTDA